MFMTHNTLSNIFLPFQVGIICVLYICWGKCFQIKHNSLFLLPPLPCLLEVVGVAYFTKISVK